MPPQRGMALSWYCVRLHHQTHDLVSIAELLRIAWPPNPLTECPIGMRLAPFLRCISHTPLRKIYSADTMTAATPWSQQSVFWPDIKLRFMSLHIYEYIHLYTRYLRLDLFGLHTNIHSC